jgi:hypothetical protein
MVNQVLLDMVKRSFVPPGAGGDPEAMGAPPGGDPNAAPPPGGQPMPAGDPNAAAAPAPPPGLDPAIIQQIVQAVQGAGAGGGVAAKPKGAGKNDETTQQLYKLNVLLMAIAKQLGVEIPDEMFLGPPPGDPAAQQQAAAPPADPAQDPNAAAQPQMMDVAPSVAMPKMAEIVPTFGSSFDISSTPAKPMVDVPMPKQAAEQQAAQKPSTTTKAAALVSLLRSLNRG